MTDKEFRKLKRSDLIAIIYEYQKKQEELVKEIGELRAQLESKNLKISKAGSIAEAVVGLDLLFETAQKTADDYIEQVRLANEEAEQKAAEIIKQAEKEAAEIVSKARDKADNRKK
jgi:cell division septum initiation protein DivIVA